MAFPPDIPTGPVPQGKQCLELRFDIPTVPDLFLPNLALTLPLPVDIGVVCCKFRVTIPGADEVIWAANAGISAVLLTGGATIMAAVATANLVIAKAQAKINRFRARIPKCPIDGATIGA